MTHASIYHAAGEDRLMSKYLTKVELSKMKLNEASEEF